jgi:hypothetical protein
VALVPLVVVWVVGLVVVRLVVVGLVVVELVVELRALCSAVEQVPESDPGQKHPSRQEWR